MPSRKKSPTIPTDAEVAVVHDKLLLVRSQPVILDSDLAVIYEAETGALNQAVNRNQDRFPEDFAFRLTKEEWEDLKCQSGTASSPTNLKSQNVISSSSHGGRRTPPRVFTEHGALMASTVLRSDAAVRMSTFIIRAFVKMREELASNREILRRLAEIDKSLLIHDSALRDLYRKILPLLSPPPSAPKREIGFHSKD
jgi:hypothetical protein